MMTLFLSLSLASDDSFGPTSPTVPCFVCLNSDANRLDYSLPRPRRDRKYLYSTHLCRVAVESLPQAFSADKVRLYVFHTPVALLSLQNPRPPHEDIDPKAAAEMLRWVASNDDVVRERQYDHIRRVSGKVE